VIGSAAWGERGQATTKTKNETADSDHVRQVRRETLYCAGLVCSTMQLYLTGCRFSRFLPHDRRNVAVAIVIMIALSSSSTTRAATEWQDNNNPQYPPFPSLSSSFGNKRREGDSSATEDTTLSSSSSNPHPSPPSPPQEPSHNGGWISYARYCESRGGFAPSLPPRVVPPTRRHFLFAGNGKSTLGSTANRRGGRRGGRRVGPPQAQAGGGPLPAVLTTPAGNVEQNDRRWVASYERWMLPLDDFINEQEQKQQHAAASVAKPRKNAFFAALTHVKIRLDVALAATYFCNAVALSLPVVLLPLIAAEYASTWSNGIGVGLTVLSGGGTSSAASVAAAAAFVAGTVSISTLGGGIGKFVNGFVCQMIGGKRAASLYLTAMAVMSFLLSVVPVVGPHYCGWILAGLEFFASIQWTACALVLSNHYYEREPANFAKGITILSLASTGGTLAAKLGGTFLLHKYASSSSSSWRTVAQGGAAFALLGSLLVRFLVSEHPNDDDTTDGIASSRSARKPRSAYVPTTKHETKQAATTASVDFQSIARALRSVLGNRLFWQVGLAHATTFLARTSDRVMGSFFQEATGIPRHLCGGLTASVTIGFVLGLSKVKAFHQLPDAPSKLKLLNCAYSMSVLSAVGLALCSNRYVVDMLGPIRSVLPVAIVALSCTMAASLSFQFYQIPPMVASTFFGKNKAVALSLMDGLGFFVSAPIWAATGKIVSTLGACGWSAAWFLLSALFAGGGVLMMRTLPQVLLYHHHQQEQKQQGNEMDGSSANNMDETQRRYQNQHPQEQYHHYYSKRRFGIVSI